MLVGLIAHPVDLPPVLVERGGFPDVVAVALNISVQIGHVPGDQGSARVVPGAVPDPVARVTGGCPAPATVLR